MNIVGHGTSLIGKGLGKEIDSQRVVRLKGSHTVLNNPDYGKRVDVLCASTEIMPTFLEMNASEYWAYPKKGEFDGYKAIKIIAKLGKPVMIPFELSNHWNQIFRKMGGQHPNVSTGMAAIIFSCHRFKEDIKLYGFDTLMDPSKSFTRNPEIPRSGHGYIDHDWETEHKLLSKIEEVYEVKIESC